MHIVVEEAEKVSCIVCGKKVFALQSPFICHGCWVSGDAARMIQRLTKRALDGLTVCENCGGWLKGGECENCNSPLTARQ